MKLSVPPNRLVKKPAHLRRSKLRTQTERGVVLILALILLVVISLLTISSMRNASSSESVAGNVRTTELATEAAEFALRHCESSVVKIQKNAAGDATSAAARYVTTFTVANILPATVSPASPLWQNLPTWDGSSASVFVLPLTLANQNSSVTYRRAPECMVITMPVIVHNNTALVANTSAFIITARGFGPEVEALSTTNRARPNGTEVWVQSNIELK